jgi:hypothetical protein
MILRASFRSPAGGPEAYGGFDWIVWVVLVLMPLISGILGSLLNERDGKAYKRYLQFLRLEFDTRLGMHSPR